LWFSFSPANALSPNESRDFIFFSRARGELGLLLLGNSDSLAKQENYREHSDNGKTIGLHSILLMAN
jgi:hypothetical protein